MAEIVDLKKAKEARELFGIAFVNHCDLLQITTMTETGPVTQFLNRDQAEFLALGINEFLAPEAG